MAEVRSTLQVLRTKGFQLVIGSSGRNTPFILERIGLSGFFDAVADGNCITRSQTDPQVFLKAAAMLKTTPAECLVVEDAHAGVEAAAAGGFDCAAMGDARDDARSQWHMRGLADLMQLEYSISGTCTRKKEVLHRK